VNEDIGTGLDLQHERAALGLTQAELGRRVGVSQATISLWENSRAQPDEVQLEALKAVLSGATLSNGRERTDGEPEGLEVTHSTGWGEYPLDAVFVRTDVRTVGEVVKRIRSDRYDLNPEFQRDFVWPEDKQSRLIESCLMRIPLPVLYVAEADDGRIVVVDGLQRLSTFRRFLDNKLKLSFTRNEDEPAHLLEGKRFDDLELKLRERVEDTQLTLYILDAKAPERAKLDIFERVNSGEPLTRQQMRNCLYNGNATRWLKRCADSRPFLSATGGSLKSKTMRDREAINRFCAFAILGWNHYRSGEMDSFLAEALDSMNNMTPEKLNELEARFTFSMAVNERLFKRHAFRKSLRTENDSDRSALNVALFDVCSVVLSTLNEHTVSLHESIIKTAVAELLGDEEFNRAITYATNDKKRVKTRFEKMENTIAEATRCFAPSAWSGLSASTHLCSRCLLSRCSRVSTLLVSPLRFKRCSFYHKLFGDKDVLRNYV
jgi:transcriptional regulator with XRE-family HTH domain